MLKQIDQKSIDDFLTYFKEVSVATRRLNDYLSGKFVVQCKKNLHHSNILMLLSFIRLTSRYQTDCFRLVNFKPCSYLDLKYCVFIDMINVVYFKTAYSTSANTDLCRSADNVNNCNSFNINKM